LSTDVSEVRTASIIRDDETSVDNHFTRQYNPEDSSEHHTRRRENLKSHNDFFADDVLVVMLYEDSMFLSNVHICISVSPHNITTQMNNTDIFTATRTSDLTQRFL
jgi:hypothetical protein